MKHQYPCVAFGLSLMTASLSTLAVEDWKSFPGALCQPTSNTQAIGGQSEGGLRNASNTFQLWICPIVRDVMGDEIEGAEITVVDRNVAAGDPSVICTLQSRTATGGFTAAESHSTAGGSATPTTLVYAAGAPNLAGATGGFYYFACAIPGVYNSNQSGVVSYRVIENDGEN